MQEVMMNLTNFKKDWLQQQTAPSTPISCLPVNRLAQPFFSDSESSDSEDEIIASPKESLCFQNQNILKQADKKVGFPSPNQSVHMKVSKTTSDILHNKVLNLRKWDLLDIEIQPSQSKKLEKAATGDNSSSTHGQQQLKSNDSDSDDMDEADLAALEPEYDFELPSTANTKTNIGLKSSSEQLIGKRRTRKEAHMSPTDHIKGHKTSKRARIQKETESKIARSKRRQLRNAKTVEEQLANLPIPRLTRQHAQRFMNIYNKCLYI